MIKKLVFSTILILIVLNVAFCYAATYYLSPSGNNTATGTTESTPWKSFAKAFGVIAAGDELVLLDGTYSEAVGTGYISWNDGTAPNSGQPPSGTSLSTMTIVRAKNAGSVTIDGGSRQGLFLGRSFRKDSYIKIQDIKFEGGGSLYNTSYITITECGFHSERLSAGSVFGIGTNDHDNGNSYNLMEDCWIWGKERIIAINYRANNNVWRRVVIRGDGGYPYSAGSPCVGITIYDSAYVSFQNVMVIDRIIEDGYAYAAFATAQHTAGSNYLGPNEWLGCIALKNEDSGFYFEADNANNVTHTLRNIVAWDCSGGNINVGGQASNIILENATSGISGAGIDNVRVAPAVITGTVRNLIAYQAGRYGVNSAIQPTYCDVYNATSGAYNQTTCTTGPKTTNPLSDGTPQSLKYLVRIEDGSVLKGTGSGGSDYGANVVKRYGIDGSRYGDTDYNTLTDTNLWPFPNEDRIKTDLSISSTRGFCADGQTLTKYIWEYLGNAIPEDIYTSDVFAPASISDLSISNTSSSSITLAWTAPGDDNNTGTATSYDIRYALTTVNDTNWTTATQVTGEPAPSTAGSTESMVITGLQSDTTYYFAMKTSDEVPNTSGISNAVSGKTSDNTAPSAVTDLTAVPGTSDGRVVVSWTAPGDDSTSGIATSYDLRLSLNTISDDNWSSATQYLSEPAPKVAGAAETITLSGLTPGSTYYFALKTSDEVPNTSALSNVSSCQAYKSGEVDITPPAGITTLSAASGAHSGEVVLNWTATGDDGSTGTALTYDIRYSQNLINAYTWGTATQCSGEPDPQVAGSAEKFVVTGLSPGQQYYFAVQAIDESNFNSGVSNVPRAVAYDPIGDTTPPEPITTLQADNSAGGEVTITWNAPGGDGASGTTLYYEIRSATYTVDASNFAQASLLDSIPVPNSAGYPEAAILYNLNIGQIYYIAVKSVDGAGNVSILSNVAFVVIGDDLIAPGTIADLAAVGGTNIGEVVIGWTASGNDGAIGKAKEYDIRYSTSQITDDNWSVAVKALNTPSPALSGTYQSATIGSLTPNTIYSFGIKASDTGSNISGLSNVATAKAKGATPPGKIDDLSGTVGSSDGSVALSWTAPAAADGDKVQKYEIRYSKEHIYEVNLWWIFSESEVEWNGAGKYPTQPTVVNPGDKQTFDLTGLDPGQKYFFAVKSYDTDSNSSVISNVAETKAATSDAIAPAKIDDLHAEPGNIDGEVILSWTAPGNDGTSGTAGSYIMKYSVGYIDTSTWDLANALTDTPTPKAAGSKEHMFVRSLLAKHRYYFAMQTVDPVGNISDISNCAETLSGPVMNLERVRSFPNPWKKASGGLITISHLTTKAKVKIFNLLGELVRELQEQNGVAFWDAKNENGQDVASGVYIYYAWDDEGHEKTGKMVIIK